MLGVWKPMSIFCIRPVPDTCAHLPPAHRAWIGGGGGGGKGAALGVHVLLLSCQEPCCHCQLNAVGFEITLFAFILYGPRALRSLRGPQLFPVPPLTGERGSKGNLPVYFSLSFPFPSSKLMDSSVQNTLAIVLGDTHLCISPPVSPCLSFLPLGNIYVVFMTCRHKHDLI